MIGYYDENPVINPEEVEDWKWMIDDVKRHMQAHLEIYTVEAAQ
jgi:isopentenyl-diphosphate delta-isomerase